MQYKSQNQYNSKIKSVFDRSDIKDYIKDVTGRGETPFENESIYNSISIHLADDAEHVSLTKKVLDMLKQNQISAERIVLIYEKEKHVYEILLSSHDYDLTENEIEARVTKIK